MYLNHPQLRLSNLTCQILDVNDLTKNLQIQKGGDSATLGDYTTRFVITLYGLLGFAMLLILFLRAAILLSI